MMKDDESIGDQQLVRTKHVDRIHWGCVHVSLQILPEVRRCHGEVDLLRAVGRSQKKGAVAVGSVGGAGQPWSRSVALSLAKTKKDKMVYRCVYYFRWCHWMDDTLQVQYHLSPSMLNALKCNITCTYACIS